MIRCGNSTQVYLSLKLNVSYSRYRTSIVYIAHCVLTAKPQFRLPLFIRAKLKGEIIDNVDSISTSSLVNSSQGPYENYHIYYKGNFLQFSFAAVNLYIYYIQPPPPPHTHTQPSWETSRLQYSGLSKPWS